MSTPQMAPWPPDLQRHYYQSRAWDGRLLTERIFAFGERCPSTPAVVDRRTGRTEISYGDLCRCADRAGAHLRRIGIQSHDRVVLQMHNSWEFVAVLLGCLRARIIPVLCMPAHGEHEILHTAAAAEATAVILEKEAVGYGRKVLDRVPSVQHLLTPTNTPERWGYLFAGPVDPPAPADARPTQHIAPERTAAESVALMLLSGGTSGLPKLIARTHNDYGCYVRRSAEASGFGPASTFLAVLPMGHSLPLGQVLGVLGSGGKVVIAASPAPETVFAAIESEQVNVSACVPAMAITWLQHAEETGSDRPILRQLLVGGARPPDSLAARLVPTLTQTLQQGYGMAEGLVCQTALTDPSDLVATVQGRPICPEDELRVVDEQERDVPPGDLGQLLTRGPCTPRAYFRGGDHDARAFTTDGWLRTGDLVRVREDGSIIVDGRVKDVINRGGEKISAEEVESIALMAPGVHDCAAVAVPHSTLGEQVGLFVVTQPQAMLDLDTVTRLFAEHGLAKFKHPTVLHRVEQLPRTTFGKTDKAALRELVAHVPAPR